MYIYIYDLVCHLLYNPLKTLPKKKRYVLNTHNPSSKASTVPTSCAATGLNPRKLASLKLRSFLRLKKIGATAKKNRPSDLPQKTDPLDWNLYLDLGDLYGRRK